jgi:hypothetical protein
VAHQWDVTGDKNMKTSLKKLLALSLIALIALPMIAVSKNDRLDWYDVMRDPVSEKKWPSWVPGTKGKKKWPPYVPGTEGQKEAKIQVLDATTMQPIEGAIVVGGYYGRSGVCTNSESAVTDAQGWATLPNDQDPRIGGDGTDFYDIRGPRPESAYKRGYQRAIIVYEATAGGHNEWYVRERKPVPWGTPGEQWETISARKFSDDHRSVLLETKERSRIYLMPSTATTKEERAEELNWMSSRSCVYTMPFWFSESEGGLTIDKAVYQEMLNVGMEYLRYRKDRVDSYEESYRDFRKRNAKE